ncbi:exonuclease [Lactobacillus sp. CBA3605]|uniref:3'-5' exonuclease n=1 Tax=Lactobacillus sp. CBA3605 TaxID=2099788 RepID=UPI000CFBA15C|nr:3'-5' exonuclease [Lactobacillus sp. CBA3605]AVK62006.1 exonuclease [Lactobacillus sp. CBA3605]
MNFVAMDFETANAKRDSACSLALTIVRNNQIVDEFYSLIKPESDFFWRNVQIHGIHETDVATAPKFPAIWDHIQPFFQRDQLVVAHNAPFDTGVLRQTLAHYSIGAPQYLSMDTVKTSKQFFPELPNHKLDTMCRALDIDLQHHHNALDDSLACANILLSEANQFGTDRLKPFVRVQG